MGFYMYRSWPIILVLYLKVCADISVDDSDPKLNAQLIEAAKKGDNGTVLSLLSQGADVNTADTDGYTPLMRSSMNGCLEMVMLLLDNGALVDKRDNKGDTALLQACYLNNKSVVRALIQRGAKVNIRAYDFVTPLHDAASEGHKDIVQILLDSGADYNTLNKDGKRPLDLAIEKRHTDIITTLKYAEMKTMATVIEQAFAPTLSKIEASLAEISAKLGQPEQINNTLEDQTEKLQEEEEVD